MQVQHHIVCMQSAAYFKHEEVCRNMCATFLLLSEDHMFQQYAPQPERIVYHVTPRQQDSSFATSLASVISEHTDSLAVFQLGKTRVHVNINKRLDICTTACIHFASVFTV